MVLRRIVAVSKEPEIQQLARQVGQEIFVADDPAEALDITETTNPDLIIFDHRFTPAHIREFLNKTSLTNLRIVVAGKAENDTVPPEEFIKIGAYDYLRGKHDYPRLEQIAIQIANNANAPAPVRNIDDYFIEECAASSSIVGRSKAIAETIRMIKLVASSRCDPIVIVGETGTGKELVAKALHNIRNPGKPFIAANCAALTANLLESELFGHTKGAFTGADSEKTGLLEMAGSGTILLDEISEIPPDLQAKLLRLLQEKTFRKVGGTKEIACPATIIASSNRNLHEEAEAGRFRKDLYYRLATCPIAIAPLRAPARREDIYLLAEYFLKTSTVCPHKKGSITSLTKLALESLQKHLWPGNVRELRNVIERAILLESTDKIGLNSIIINPFEHNLSADCLSSAHNKDFSLSKAERELIARALQETGWQKTQAASLLGITRATLYAKVKQYNIDKTPHPAKTPADTVLCTSP
jgi:DNA-binding NtrC family response regulator